MNASIDGWRVTLLATTSRRHVRWAGRRSRTENSWRWRRRNLMHSLPSIGTYRFSRICHPERLLSWCFVRDRTDSLTSGHWWRS